MTVANPFALQEIKVLFKGTTFSDQFTDGDHANWVHDGSDCYKVRSAQGVIDLSGLTYPRIEDPSARTRLRGKAKGILGLRTGGFQLACFLNTTKADNFLKTMLSKALGGLFSPGASAYQVEAGCTTTSLADTGIGAALSGGAGSAILVGTRGDGNGDGEVIPIASLAADAATLSRACSGAPALDSWIWPAYTCYPDPDAATQYMDFFFIGDDSTSPDQINCVGCAVRGLSFGQLAMGDGELPVVIFDIGVTDWRYEPAASKGIIAHTTTPKGADPAMDRGLGGLYMTTSGSAQARGYLLGGNLSIDADFVRIPVPDPQYANQIGGWALVPGYAKFGFTALTNQGSPSQPVPEIQDGFEAGTSYQLMFQFGHAADACAAVAIDTGYVDKTLKRTELNQLAGWMVEGHAEESATTTDLLAADFKVHLFETV